jgi:hypothetical protein
LRIHQIPATPYMLDVTDELGLMVIDETAIRGSNNRQNFLTGRDAMVNHVRDLVRRDRNHPSVLRWSQANEPVVPLVFENPGSGPEFDEARYQTVKACVPTRPVSTDGNSEDLPHEDHTVFCQRRLRHRAVHREHLRRAGGEAAGSGWRERGHPFRSRSSPARRHVRSQFSTTLSAALSFRSTGRYTPDRRPARQSTLEATIEVELGTHREVEIAFEAP